MRTWVRFAVVLVVAGIGLALAAILLMPEAQAVFTAGKGSKDDLAKSLRPLSERSVVLARDGSTIAVLHAEENRVPIKLSDVPPNVVKAVIDIEDDRFYEHGGIDLRSLGRALATNISAGGVRQGGSTITQQLVKNSLLSPKQDVHRKLKEAVLSMRLESQMSKDQILERYLNTVYFGNGAYGIEAAAENYYGVKVGQLTTAQGALLAGLIQNPVYYDPFRYPETAKTRRAEVADRMAQLHHISNAEATQIKDTPLPAAPVVQPTEKLDYFADKVKQILLGNNSPLGGTPQDRYQEVFNGGLRIHTTLDPKLQQVALQKINANLPDTNGKFTAALVSMDPTNGAVRALVGGTGFDQAQYDIVTDGARQPGSSFKAFTLMAALEQGHSPNDIVDGTAPCPIPNPGGTPNPYSPANFEGEEGGPMTITDATAHSVNCAYVHIQEAVGEKNVIDVANRMGITHHLTPIKSLTLGTETVSPLEMATSYATLAADGERHDPYFIQSVDDRNGKEVFSAKPKGRRAVASQNARVETSVLQQVVQRGTGTRAGIPGRQVAGKTGTAEDFHDAWFVGYTPQLATAVWMGSPKAEVPMTDVGGISVQGGSYPAQIWGAYMTDALAGQPAIPFPQPDYSLIPAAQTIGSPPAPTTSVGPATSAPATSAPPPVPSIPAATIPQPVITRPPRPTVPPTEPRTVPTRAPRCYTNPRTGDTICR
ncbi:MAG: PBP1A family penicillin-binding protein [Acidimicrobiia bacterium]|nr:PBP1A family penicillin-binding protein [Acidimicrobiia bacterium]